MPRTKAGVSGEIKVLERGRLHSVRVRLPPDETHKGWHWSPWRRVKGNKTKANAELEAYAKELRDNASGRGLTVAEYVDRWQDARKALGKVSDLTLKRDEPDLRRIKAYIGNVRLRDLTAERIESFYIEATNVEGLSASGCHKLHAKLRQILKRAYQERIIDRNPCDAIEGVTRPGVAPEKRKTKRVMTADAQRFARELREEPKTGKTVAVWLALATGMRRGEVLAMTWGAVDLKAGRIQIRAQYGKEHRSKETKTEKSRRTIAVDEVTISYLKDWREIQATALAKKAIAVNEATPVCSNRNGGYLDPDSFSRWRRAFYVKHGLGHYEDPENKRGYVGPDLHELRHAQATMLIAAGMDPKTVQTRLGHARISTTLEIYAEAEREKDQEAANKIGSLLG